MKIKNILIGWGKKWGFLPSSEAEKKLSELRMNICKTCPQSAVSPVLEFANGEAEYVKIMYCRKCTCPLQAKTLVILESCPLNKW